MTAHASVSGHPGTRGLPVSWAVCVLALASCTETAPQPPAGKGPGLAVTVAALELSEVTDACYNLAITNDAGDPVWSQQSLCASDFGAGADISYVAPCDATDVDGGGAMNTVTLTIDAILGLGGTPITDYVDPCAAPFNPGGCQLTALCRENADTPVVFNLTVMRRAYQGFFDIAVNFSNIFCSAKVDCIDSGNDPIRLVHDPVSLERVETVVLALACTDGSSPGDPLKATHLYRDPIQIVCGTNTHTIDPSEGPGNVYVGGVGAPDPIVQAMVFEGVESLNNAATGQPADKLYWNVALGLDTAWFSSQAAGTTCYLRTRMTAAEGALDEGAIDTTSFYPYIDVDVPLWSTGSAGARLCSRHPLDGAPVGVATRYTEPSLAPTEVFDYVGTAVTGAFASSTILPPPAPACGGEPGWTPMVNLLGPNRSTSYTDIATDGDGKWVVLAVGSGPAPTYEAEMWMAYSHDDRVTWQTTQVTVTGANDITSNPASLAYVGQNTYVAAFRAPGIGNDGDIFFTRSVDGGANWTSPSALQASASSDSGYDASPSVAAAPNGTVIAAWQAAGSGSDIRFARSVDRGATWGSDVFLNNAALSSNPNFNPKVATNGSGRWVVGWYGRDPIGTAGGADNDIFFVTSGDDGLSWTQPEALNGNAGTDSGYEGDLAISFAGGTFIAAWQSRDSLGGTIGTDDDLLFSRSTDGMSWSPVSVLNTNAATDAGADNRVALAGDGLGVWVAIWYTDTDFAGDANQDNVFAVSTTDGATWSAPMSMHSPDERFIERAITTDGKGEWAVAGTDSSTLFGTFVCGDDFGGP